MRKANYTKFDISLVERLQEHRDITDLMPYILALKKQHLGCLKCEMCGAINKELDIHHKKYGPDITYYDLILLCVDCHVDADYNF